MFRHTCKLDLETKVHDPVCTYDEVNVETTYMHASSAYALTGIQLLLLSMCLHTQCVIVAVQSAKLDEGNYEEIPSNTHEGSEPTYSGVVN